MYYHIYLYHSNKYNYHCVMTQTLQNGQTLGQFFELLYVYVLYRRSSKYYSLYLKPCLIHIQARLADNYVECLSAVNSVEPYKGQNIVHVPFAPPYHVLQAHRKVFFFYRRKCHMIHYRSLGPSNLLGCSIPTLQGCRFCIPSYLSMKGICLLPSQSPPAH